MPPSEGRAGNIVIWLISGFFLTSILGGSCFLVLYIALPLSKTTSLFPVAGLVLIGIPWAFWIVLCVYRSLAANLSRGPADRPSFRAAVVAPVGWTNSSSNATEGGDGQAEDRGSANAAAMRAAGPNGEGSPGASRESQKPLTQSMS